MEQRRIWDRGSREDEVEDKIQQTVEEARCVHNDEDKAEGRMSLPRHHPTPLAGHDQEAASVPAVVDGEEEV